MAKPKQIRPEAAARLGMEPGTWWSVTIDGRTGLLAMAFPDTARPEGDRLMLLVVQDVDGKPAAVEVHPSQVMDATRMALVDQDWTTRARDDAAHISDGRRRLGEIDPTVQSVSRLATSLVDHLESPDYIVTVSDDAAPDVEPGDLLRAARQVVEGLAILTSSLQPTKDGIVWR